VSCEREDTPANFIQVSREGQAEVVEALAKEIWTEHYTSIIGRGQVDYMLGKFQTKKAIWEQIKDGENYFLIETGGKFIGYIAVRPEGHELFVSKIYVSSSNRRRGFGKKAVQFIECVARGKGLTRISLTVNKNNTGSIKAYENLGFTNTGPAVRDIGGGFVMDDYRMERNVSSHDTERPMLRKCGRRLKGE
jgi:RimJ/RimL family protein N-acetyltransferase